VSSHVTFIYIALFKIQIVSKQLVCVQERMCHCVCASVLSVCVCVCVCVCRFTDNPHIFNHDAK